MTAARILVARDADRAEVLVWLWDSGEVQVATRPEPGAVWGPPLEVISDERSEPEPSEVEKERMRRALREFGITDG